MRAGASARPDGGKDRFRFFRGHDLFQIISVIPHVPPAFGQDLARQDLSGLGEHEVHLPGVAGEGVRPLLQGPVDQAALEQVLGGLDARAPEPVDRRAARPCVPLQTLDGAEVFFVVNVQVSLLGEVPPHQGNGVGPYAVQRADKVYDRLHVVLVPGAEHRVHPELELRVAVEKSAQQAVCLQGPLEASRCIAQIVMGLPDAVERKLRGDHAFRAVLENALHAVPDKLREQAVRRIEQEGGLVVPVKGRGDLDEVFPQEDLPAGEGEPEQGAQRTGDPLDLLERKLRPGGRGSVRGLQIEAVRAARVAPLRHEERQMHGPSFPEDGAGMSEGRVLHTRALRAGKWGLMYWSSPVHAPARTAAG